MKLVLAEKPSVAQSIAKVLGATKREDGYLEGNGYVVSWCVGHLVELSQPEAYDEKYNKWAYLRYVFDVADTGVRRSSPSITPWRVTDENRRFIMDEMERVFQVPSEGILEYQLENIAINLAREYWDDFKKPILDIVADSFLEEYDEYNIEVAFKTAVANSVSYAMYSRITENPDNYFEHEDTA